MGQEIELNEPAEIDVQLAFEHWRKHRTRRERTPDHLRHLVVQLLESRSHASVCKALAINATTLKHWAGKPVVDTVAPVPSGFIELDTTPVMEKQRQVSKSGLVSLSIRLPNGVEVEAEHSGTLAEVFSALNQMAPRS